MRNIAIAILSVATAAMIGNSIGNAASDRVPPTTTVQDADSADYMSVCEKAAITGSVAPYTCP